jgi:beta-lactamase regulating signal transducer with metallopeptidase domain
MDNKERHHMAKKMIKMMMMFKVLELKRTMMMMIANNLIKRMKMIINIRNEIQMFRVNLQ